LLQANWRGGKGGTFTVCPGSTISLATPLSTMYGLWSRVNETRGSPHALIAFYAFTEMG